jgi:histidinol-phosphate aminotransferase
MSVSALPPSVQKRLASLRTYQPGASASDDYGKLSSNESPLGPAPAVRLAVAAAADRTNRYPGVEPLRAALAAHEGVCEQQLVITNGSDELCYLIATLFVEAGAVVVLSEPCYQIDELVSRLQQGEPVLVPLRDDGGHDLEAMAAAALDAAVLWLPTPHNPTGVIVELDELECFLDEVPSSCLVVLDEAYRPYVDEAQRPDSIRLVGAHPNLIVQRTFSKAQALAGLRLGYGIGSRELVGALNGIRPPFNVNAAAIAGGLAAIESSAWSEYGVALVRRERDLLEATLAELRIEYFPSQANFVTLKPPDSGALKQGLLAEGLVVRDGDDLGFAGWVRVSIGAAPEMAAVRRVLRRLV